MKYQVTYSDGTSILTQGVLATHAALQNFYPPQADLPVRATELCEVHEDGSRHPVEILHRQPYSGVGFAIPGSAQEVLEVLKAEMLAILKPEDRKEERKAWQLEALKAWQLPRAQWEAVMAARSIAYGVFPSLSPEVRSAPRDGDGMFSKSLSDHLDRFCWDQFGDFQRYCRHDHQTNGRHEVHVAYALLEGHPVPEEVIAEYRGGGRDGMDLRWMHSLIEHPYLRGWTPAMHFSDIDSLLRADGLSWTPELAQRIKVTLSDLRGDATRVDIDNTLYRAGILPAPTLAPLVPAPTDSDPQVEELAQALREMRFNDAQAHHDNELALGRLSLREHMRVSARDKAYNLGDKTVNEQAARTIGHIRQRNIEPLLALLDRPSDTNQVSKAMFTRMTGVKLNGLKAADRTRAIFAYCGMDEQQQRKWLAEAELLRQERAAKSDRAATFTVAKSYAENFPIEHNGQTSTADKVGDDLLAQGFRHCGTTGRGKSIKFFLQNADRSLQAQVPRELYNYVQARVAMIEAGDVVAPWEEQEPEAEVASEGQRG